MNIFWAIFLGVIQGLTEFIPVSSSGHLVIAQRLIPVFEQPGVLFDVVLHAGTLFSVLFFFRKSILRLAARYLSLLVIGTFPAVIVGLMFQSTLEGFFESTRIVGFGLLITAFFTFLTDRVSTSKREISLKDSFVIGIFQALAIVPGISRSGSTILGGVLQKITKEEAAKFSFLLSVPAIFGANVLQFLSHEAIDRVDFVIYLSGFFAAFASGFFAIKVVYKFLLEKKFKYFAIYCFILGIFVLFFFR